MQDDYAAPSSPSSPPPPPASVSVPSSIANQRPSDVAEEVVDVERERRGSVAEDEDDEISNDSDKKKESGEGMRLYLCSVLGVYVVVCQNHTRLNQSHNDFMNCVFTGM